MDQEFNDLENEMASSKETPMIKTPRLKIVIVPCPRTSGTFFLDFSKNTEKQKHSRVSFYETSVPASDGHLIYHQS